jgi:hypothetical protein
LPDTVAHEGELDMPRTRFLGALLLPLACLAPLPVHADIIVPSGLSTGDQFRLVYVTGSFNGPGSIDATSDDVAHYDAFVELLAIIDGLTTQAGSSDFIAWHALVSTPTSDIRDRLPGSGVDMYQCGFLGCERVALGTHDIWADGNIGEGITEIAGGGFCSGVVYTGSRFDGTASGAMGTSEVTLGRCGFAGNDWIFGGAELDTTEQRPLYMYSDVITVASSSDGGGGGGSTAPEPGSLALLASAAVFSWLRSGLRLPVRRRRAGWHAA